MLRRLARGPGNWKGESARCVLALSSALDFIAPGFRGGRLYARAVSARREHFNRKGEGAGRTWVDRANADDVARRLIASLVLDGHDDRVLPGFFPARVANRALDAEWNQRWHRRRRRRGCGIESQMLPA